MRGSIGGWHYEISRAACSVCCEVGSVLGTRGDREDGTPLLCEHCVLCAGMAWRRVAGEVPPGFPDEDVARVTSVSVLVARRRDVPGPLGASPPLPGHRQSPTSYEFLTVPVTGAEYHVLPTLQVLPGLPARDDGLKSAALEILESVGLRSWRPLLETLHVGYTPRGRLSVVVLARGYSHAEYPQQGYSDVVQGVWKAWPLSAHAGKLAGYYEFMEAAWPARLYKLCVPDDRLPAEISVFMREAARRCVELQSAVGEGGDVDSSMLAAYRSAMSADELAAAEVVRRSEDEERARKSRKQLPPIPSEGEASSGGGQEEDVVLDGGSGYEDSENSSVGDGGDDEGGSGEMRDDSPTEPGFARRFPRR